MENVKNFLDLIQVYDCGMTKIRIGNERDGGYVALKELCEKTERVYSFGVGNDVGFEMDWVNKYPDTDIELFDPLIDELPEKHKRFSFRRYGIGLRWKPLTGVAPDSLLKVDVEWDEWGGFLVFREEELRKFSQILVEFHMVHVEPRKGLTSYFQGFYQNVLNTINQDLFAQYCDVIRRLTNWFFIFHIHANNSLPMIAVNGHIFPPLIELSFVRKDLIRHNISDKNPVFPVAGLDYPNKTDRPDILNYYPLGRRNAE